MVWNRQKIEAKEASDMRPPLFSDRSESVPGEVAETGFYCTRFLRKISVRKTVILTFVHEFKLPTSNWVIHAADDENTEDNRCENTNDTRHNAH